MFADLFGNSFCLCIVTGVAYREACLRDFFVRIDTAFLSRYADMRLSLI